MASTVKSKTAVVTLIVNGKSAEANVKDFGSALRSVNKELRSMSANDPNFQKRLEEKRMITREYLKQKAAIGDVRTGWQKFMTEAGKIGAGVIGANLFQVALMAIYASLTKLINIAGKVSDEMANIAKTTGLSTSEVKELNEELSKMDTRTSMENLRKLAEEAGRLGYTGKEDIMEFVKAADMINVALGDSLGEGAVKDIAKLTDIFKLKEIYGVEGAMLRVGSAINDIGMASTANEGYIVDFLKRMSGISGIANVSVQELIALGGTLDSLGQTSEVSSTALNKLLVKMGGDVKTYAKMAGVSMEEFRKVMDKSAVEGLMMVLKQVGKTTGGIEQLSATLGELGLDGGRVVAILGTLSKNTDEYSRQLGISTNAMEKNTSITNEFNIKNQNTAAVLDKIGKKFTLMWETTANGAAPFIESFGKMIGVVSDLDIQLGELQIQQNRVTQAESKFPALLKRYDELKTKTKLSGEEQKELQKIVNEIANEVPQAATSFDKYGNALDLNREKVLNFIADQRSLLEAMRQTRREMLREEMQSAEQRAKVLQYEVNLQKKYRVNSGGKTITEDMTTAEINAKRQELGRLQADIRAMRGDMQGLEGIDSMANRRLGRNGAPKPAPFNTTTTTGGGSMSKEDEKAAKKALKDQEDLNDALLKNQQQVTLSMMKEHQKELQAAVFKYDALREKAKGNAAQLATIAEQEVKEIGQINKKHNDKFKADADKMFRSQLDFINATSKADNEYAEQAFENEAKRRDKELFEINDHYQKEIALAKSRGLSVVTIEKRWRAEIEALNLERTKDKTDNFLEGISDSYRSELALADEAGTSKELIIQAHLERLRLLREQYGYLDIEQTKKVNSEIARSERDLMAMKLENIQKMGGAMSAGGNVMSDVLSLMANDQSQYAEFQKALGLFQIAVDTGTAIASAVAQGTKGDPYTVALRIATAVAAVTAGMVKAKQLISSTEKPATPSFATGGYSDTAELNRRTGGYFGRATLFRGNGREYIAGEAGKEFIVSNMALQNPRVAAFTDMLDSVQKTQNWGRLNSLDPRGSGRSASAVSSNMYTDPQLIALQQENNKLLQRILQKPGGINYRLFEDFKDQVDDVRNRASA